jgi:hypothetical protein
MNFWQRHLNWTMVLGWIGGAISIYAAMIGTVYAMTNEWWLISVFGLAGIFGGVYLSWRPTIWAIKQKGRSLWWLLMWLVPFGWISWLCLENRNLY